MSTSAYPDLLADSLSSPCSNQEIAHLSDSNPFSTTDMKDVSTASKAARPSAYPKKRPSPYGISKSRKSPLYPPSLLVRRTPRAARAEMTAQRQRNAQILALRRQGIYLEEEYQDEIRAYMHEMERHTTCSITSMDQQPEIRWHMRPCLVDFLVEIHFTFRLRPETLYLALNIIDRYVSRRIVYVKHYQLVGCAALWIAAKFEDAKDRVPSIEDLVQICGKGTYDQIAFIQMEGHVLQTIQWSLGHPTAEAWLRLLCADRWLEETRVQHVARFLMEITLFYREFVRCLPSSIALGSLTLARYLCGKARRAFEETEECLEVVELLDNRLSKHVNHLSETLVRKYSFAFFSKAATLVVHYYLHGGRFVRQPSLSFPMTPVRSHSANIVSTPMSVSTTASDFSDDMPATPTSPMFSSDPFSGSCLSDDKENLPSPIFEPIIHKIPAEPIPDQFLPHDFVTLSRPALHSLNVSPRATVVA